MDKPTVRFQVPESADSSASEFVTTTTMTTTITKSPRSSPKKKSHARTLDEKLEAEVKRRSSMTNEVIGGEDNLKQIVSSLRRQNEDLRAKIAHMDSANHTNDTIDEEISKLKSLHDRECGELRKTITSLEGLLNLERQDRELKEQQTLELLSDVKRKWHDREASNLQEMKKKLEDANTVVEGMELELLKSKSAEDSAKAERDSLVNIKERLKSKLVEYKSRLEAYVAKCEDLKNENTSLAERLHSLEEEKKNQFQQTKVQKRRESMAVAENKHILDEANYKIEKLQQQKDDLADKLTKSELDRNKVLSKLEVLEREKKQIDSRFENFRTETEDKIGRLRKEKNTMEDKLSELETKNFEKDEKLTKLDGVLKSLENKVPSKESINAIKEKAMKEKEIELTQKLEELQKEFSFQKVELRIAERKLKENKEHMAYLRSINKEDREKKESLEKEVEAKTEKWNGLQSQLDSALREKKDLSEQIDNLQKRFDKVNKDLVITKSEVCNSNELQSTCEHLQQRVDKLTEELKKLTGVEKKYQLTKQLCLELEGQIKETENLVKKMEATHQKLQDNYEALKVKAETSAADYIKAKSEANEFKSMKAFKETQLKDLQEKNLELEKFYSTEGSNLKTRVESLASDKKDLTAQLMALENHLSTAEADNVKLYDQNTKLKEELATLITSIQSLKDSNLTLQETIQTIADKLSRRDSTIDNMKARLKQLETDLDAKDIEHKVTLDQLKKLAQHLPNDAIPTPSAKRSRH